MRGWKIFLLGWALVFAGSYLAHRIQTMDGIRVQDVRFTGTGGTPMSGLLYIPPTATPGHPAPGILAIHGYINSRETQDGFAIAFARSGYVVLAIDQTGHGYSGGTVAANGYGGPDGLKYLRSLDIVDKDNIGLEGHSMGGWAVLKAAAAAPNDYKAMVLEGSATGVRISTAGAFASPEGTPDFPRNVAVVYSRYDEFAPLMWRVDQAAKVGESDRLKNLFATSATVEAGRLYGDIVKLQESQQLVNNQLTQIGERIDRLVESQKAVVEIVRQLTESQNRLAESENRLAESQMRLTESQDRMVSTVSTLAGNVAKLASIVDFHQQRLERLEGQ